MALMPAADQPQLPPDAVAFAMLPSMDHQEVTIEYAKGRSLKLETGEIGRLASGSVMLTSGDTMVYCNACVEPEAKEGLGFAPFSVHFQERMSAGGRTLCALPPPHCGHCHGPNIAKQQHAACRSLRRGHHSRDD